MLVAFLSAVFVGVLSGTARAQVPGILNHIGYVQVNGVPFSGSGQFKFALIRTNGATTTLWSHDGTSVNGSEPISWINTNLVQGRYSIPIGDISVPGMTSEIPTSAVEQTNPLLRVWFNDGANGFQLLSPDQPLLSVPYALRAASVPDNAIGSAQLADGAVQSAEIADGAVATVDLANNAVTTAKILDGTITSADIANGTIASLDITDGTITTSDVADGTLTVSDFNLSNVDLRYVLKAGDTMTGDLRLPKLAADTGIETSKITNRVGVLSLVSRTDIELTIDNGGGANASFEIFNAAGTHLFLLSETGNARTFGNHAVDGLFSVGTTTLDANAAAQINLPNSASVPHLRIKSALGDNGFGIQFVNPDETWQVGPNIGNWPDDRFNILSDSSHRGLIIAANGNVGIDSVSSASPFSALTVDGTIGFPTVSTPAMYVYPGGISNPEKRVIVHSPAFPEYGLYYADVGDRFIMKSSITDNAPSLVVDLDGNWVAIATDTPKPGYELSVRGQIVCEELLVEAFANWPDYVFRDDYRLQPLEEVEAHIKENKHLPGIPTAGEVAKNGLLIGEMQKKMMEKIEELTLHLIEQNKRMSAQDERIRQLEAQLQSKEGGR